MDHILSEMALEHLQNNQVGRIQALVFPPEYHEKTNDVITVFNRPGCFGFTIISSEHQTHKHPHVLAYVYGFPIDPFGNLPTIPAINPSDIMISRYPPSLTPIFLYDCCVDPTYHRKSFGKTIVNAFINHAKKLGYNSRIWAVAINSDVEKFWKRLGFNVVTFNPLADPKDYDEGSDSWWNAREQQLVLPPVYISSGSIFMSFPLNMI